MFLTLDGDKATTEKFIQKVVYHLHPSYKENIIEVSEYPFIMSYSAYQPFIVGTEIIFHPWTG
jgi:transcription initiation factor IIF auxiliary subunit